MRNWLIAPTLLCRKHLLGEHCETHMFIGTLRKGISVQGYIDKGLIHPAVLVSRHEELVREMTARGYNHTSQIDTEEVEELVKNFPRDEEIIRAIKAESIKELTKRCPDCNERIQALTFVSSFIIY